MTASAALIVGGGRFGRLAVEALARDGAGPRALAIIEPQPSPELVELCRSLSLEIRREDGVLAVQAALAAPGPPEWIVPCLPLHLLGEWLMSALASRGPTLLALPEQVFNGLDLAQMIPGPRQAWHLSLTDSFCPPDCPEPAGQCLKTGQPRGRDLHERLAGISLPGFSTAVLRSRQLAPGLGGLRSGEMLALRGRLAARGGSWLVATACRCHGVMQALSLEPAAGKGEGA